ncbi:MAG: glycosyltransferase [Clostridiales bacterium]|jgi:glycosyltransferase involved in cell wall biosynthesis|nr:glycosyltransferase [Clostridiales bacterium]
MKVLMQGRINLYSLPGGDTIQLTKTKNELQGMGINVDLSLKLDPDLSNIDIVHLSNITRVQETYLHVKNAMNYKKPIVLSTIYWPTEETEKVGQSGIRLLVNRFLSIDDIERSKAIARFVSDKSSRPLPKKDLFFIGYTQMQSFVVRNADVLLPNSFMEIEQLEKRMPQIAYSKYVIVPNGIDLQAAKKALDEPERDIFKKFKNAIICVGRIETRKNQLSLVQALDESGYKVVLVGTVSNSYKNYFSQIKKYLDKNDKFFHIPRLENDEIYQLYRVCRVSALPSWCDTPGLVSLEAGAMGCNLAVSNRGTATDYFGNEAFYCEPNDLSSIRIAVDLAFKKKNDGALQKKIFERYTWKKAAIMTLKGYELALQKHSN